MIMSNRMRVTTLWVVFLFGMTFHAILGVMPIFFGADVAMPDATGETPAGMMLLMLLFFLIPMVAVVMSVFVEAKWYRIANFVLTLAFTLFNAFHLIQHLGEAPVEVHQVLLLAFLLISGVLLNIASYRWMRE